MSSLRILFFPVIIILLGFALRIHRLDAVPLRGDEAFSVLYWANTPLKVSLTEIAHGEPHTPLVYAVGRLWNHFIGGIDSIFALRYLSVLGNVIGIPAIFALGWRLSRSRLTGIIAAFMWALHPFEIWHSQEFRNYAYWGGISVTALWLGLRLVDRPRREDWYLYALVAGFAVLSIYTEFFTTIALACFALITRRDDWRFLRRLFALQLVMAALLVLGLLLLQVQRGFMDYYPGLAQPFSIPDYFTRFVPVLVLGSTIPIDQASLGLALSLACALAAVILYQRSARQFRFALLVTLLPLILLGIASQRYNLFHPRYVLSAAPGFILLLALGSRHLSALAPRYDKAAVCLLLAPWLALALLTLNAHFNDAAFRKAPAWDELGAFLNPRVTAEDLVIQLAVDPAFGYYYKGPAEDIGLPVKPAQTEADIARFLKNYTSSFESVYVVAREQAGWQNAGLVEAWMNQNWQEILRTDASGLPIRQYMPWKVTPTSEDELTRFENAVALVSGDYCPVELPHGELLLHLYWKPLSRPAASLKSFVHVYAADQPPATNSLKSQDDQYPQDGRLDSLSWTVGEVFREVYYLPGEALTEEEYDVRVGWYNPADGKRLVAVDGSDLVAVCGHITSY